LRLERNDALDLCVAERRQFHEARENELLCDRVVDRAALDPQLAQHLPEGSAYLPQPHLLFGRFDMELSRTITA
jgi:hypothetical protein